MELVGHGEHRRKHHLVQSGRGFDRGHQTLLLGKQTCCPVKTRDNFSRFLSYTIVKDIKWEK
jgi:hypothetical protein